MWIYSSAYADVLLLCGAPCWS